MDFKIVSVLSSKQVSTDKKGNYVYVIYKSVFWVFLFCFKYHLFNIVKAF